MPVGKVMQKRLRLIVVGDGVRRRALAEILAANETDLDPLNTSALTG